jgi:signal transduction histidine kinase
MRRARAFGLRPRLLAALMLTSAVTLAVAALALLGPLEQRLRTDGEQSVLTAVANAKPRFTALHLSRATGLPPLVPLRVAVATVRKTTDGEVDVLDSRLQVIDQPIGVDSDISLDYDAAREALVTDEGNHSLVGSELIDAVPVRIGGRLFAVEVRRRLGYVDSAVDTVTRAFIEAAAVGLLVALLLGIGISSTLLRRLERLRDATLDMQHGALDTGDPVDRGRDEIGDLARAFAIMQRQLRRQEAARRAFIATASHELRTPLASLDGMLELLEDDLTADHLDLEDARERTARAKEQTRRLSQLATDLLDLSRLDADLELRTEPLELGEICRAVAAEFELRAGEAHVGLEVTPPPEPCWVVADPGAVARVIRILIDNALRVSATDSSIRVEMSCEGTWASATVSDEGPGVPDAERELIFERFQRGSSSVGRTGFGLGLAIGRELADRMGGSLTLATSRPGERGACFSLRLPLAMSGAHELDHVTHRA